jgi:hypothetical protein
MKTAIAVLLLALAGGTAIVLAGGAAMAQSLVPQSSASRYSMQPVEGGVARLDTQTGEMSLCQVEDGRMTCQTSEEERTLLEQRIRELSDAAPTQRYEAPDDGDTAPSAPAPTTKGLPDDAELDRALGQMKHIFRTFRDLARELGDEAPAPDRT